MAYRIPPRAAVFIGTMTVVIFLVIGLSFLPENRILAASLLILAAFRLYVLLKQARLNRQRKAQFKSSKSTDA